MSSKPTVSSRMRRSTAIQPSIALLSVTLMATAVAMAAPASGAAQQLAPYHPGSVSAADYQHAESLLGANTAPLAFGASVRPTFLDGDRFWYLSDIPNGTEFVLVDPAKKTRVRAFDQEALARALSTALDSTVAPFDLPFSSFDFVPGGIRFEVGKRAFTCDAKGTRCTASDAGSSLGRDYVLSPDGKEEAFRRANNLWVTDVATGAETQLTTDGIEDFGYATDNAGWTKSDRPVLLWSPDSKKIATFQHDSRGVGMQYLVSTKVGHPELQAWKYPMPGDSVIFRISRVIVDLDGPRVIRLKMPPDEHRSTVCDHVMCGGTFADVEWSSDSKQLAFVSSSRDHKDATLRVADAATGDVRDVLAEHTKTFYESGYNMADWRFLPGSNEVIWYSERDDWGHLYLYDLNTGALKRQITKGEWKVLQVLRVDPDARTVWFTGGGKEPGDPYFQYLYSVSIDGGEPKLLTPDSANHVVTLTPSGKYFVDQWSTPVVPPVAVVRDLKGKEVVALEKADISRVVRAGWKPPIPFTVKARDGKTDLYGLMYTPTRMDSTKAYPVVNYLYPGPQSGSVGSRSFALDRHGNQALAELGFIVVELDAMGTPLRSKSFHEAYYGNMGDNGLPDQVGGIQQLGAAHPWIDLTRVGIWGHSGGGFASTAGILHFPDFYKVAWSESGNHDNRTYEDDWGEKWQGLLETHPDGTTNYDNQANQLDVAKLKGKLMLVHGTVDDNVPPNNTLQLADKLIADNKDFDLLMLPNQRHGYGRDSAYILRKRWDYFVKNLLGAEPPREYQIGGHRPIS